MELGICLVRRTGRQKLLKVKADVPLLCGMKYDVIEQLHICRAQSYQSDEIYCWLDKHWLNCVQPKKISFGYFLSSLMCCKGSYMWHLIARQSSSVLINTGAFGMLKKHSWEKPASIILWGRAEDIRNSRHSANTRSVFDPSPLVSRTFSWQSPLMVAGNIQIFKKAGLI